VKQEPEYTMLYYPLDPKLAKDRAEERQRDILEEVEAEELAEGDEVLPGEYQPITDSEDDLIQSRRKNTYVKKE
jgi:hypothetical protein